MNTSSLKLILPSDPALLTPEQRQFVDQVLSSARRADREQIEFVSESEWRRLTQ